MPTPVAPVREERADTPAIGIAGVRKAYGASVALAGVDLEVPARSLTALLGPSGSGKSTLLRVVAGFEAPDTGEVRVGGRLVVGPRAWVEPERRRTGMVFQEGALFPHLTVAGNVAFGTGDRRRVRECLELVGLGDRERSYPHELSGGERQRVALARALAPEPQVVLLDEPFAALDAGLRESLRGDVARILREAGATALLVTHDQAEALSVADQVAVLRQGCIAQHGTPEAVYERPASRWVAEFLGEADVLPGRAADGVVECELGRFGMRRDVQGEVDVLVRPESVAVGAVGRDRRSLSAEVVERAFFGHDQLVTLRLPSGRRVRSRRLGFPAWHPGDRVQVWVDGPVSALPRE